MNQSQQGKTECLKTHSKWVSSSVPFILCFEMIDPTEEDMMTMGFVQFNFNTIRKATDEFSDENKLGEGGLGAVYKVINHKGCSFVN